MANGPAFETIVNANLKVPKCEDRQRSKQIETSRESTNGDRTTDVLWQRATKVC